MKSTLVVFTCKILALSPAILVATESQKHPHVILINADELGYGDLSCYGAEKVKDAEY